METLNTDRVKYVYDITMTVDTERGAEPNLTNLLKGRKMIADIYVRRFETADIPKTTEGAAKWLVDLCVEKDWLLDSYKRSGMQSFTSHLPEDKKALFQEYKPIRMEKRWAPVVTTLLLNMCICLPIVYKLGSMALSGSMSQLAIATSIVMASFFVLKKFIGLTKIKKGPKKSN